MAKMMLVVVMMHVVMAKRSNNWLDDTKHLSVREQSEEEPSMDENQADLTIKSLEGRDGFQDVLDSENPNKDRWNAILNKPLDVTASAVAFCADLFKEVQLRLHETREVLATEQGKLIMHASIRKEAMAAEDICPKVLTGSLGSADSDSKAPEFAKKAAKVAKLDGKPNEFGRLSKVAWKKSLQGVCHDECHALVQGIHDKAYDMQNDLDELITDGDSHKSQSLEGICADRVVREVESEIMTCCASSCGWNGRSCMFWPLMNPSQQADWQSECCTEMNILQGSTRERLCDATLSKHDKEISKAIIDKRFNTEVDREIIGQDGDVSVASSFMETSSMRSFRDECPPPLNLDQLHEEWKTDWKVMDLTDLKSPEGAQKVSTCAMNKDRQPTINGCKVFQLLQTEETNSEEKQRTYDYKCLDDCHMQEPEEVRGIDSESSSSDGIVYIHKDKLPKATKS